ncbi:transposable element Tc1 transposase [Trichonephila clavipes]|nr:transposable element Tc1 transposase [Trichonephila clavipes]
MSMHIFFSTSVYHVAAVAEWYRHRIVAGFVTSSIPVPLKTRRVGQRCTLNLSRAETSSRWCGVVVRRGGASSGVASHDHGSKLRGPSPKALVQLNSATLIFTHSLTVYHVITFIRALKVLTRVDSCCFKSKFYRKDLIDELKIFGMSYRHYIDDFMRGRIIGKIEEGRKITDVAREFDIAHSVVSRLWKSFKTTGKCSRRHVGGRVRSTTPAENRYIVLSAKRNRHTTAQQVANQFLAASGKQISRKTVARRLRGGGLYARRPVLCVLLTRQHRTARLQWCREHHNWTEHDWACVLFSDESRFSLSSDCRRQLIWRERGTAYRPENIQEKDRYPTCRIMVWVGIMINGRTRLHVVANGTLTGQRYIDEILLPHVRLFRGAVGDKFVFMDDNATCHRTLAVQDCLDSEGIQRLVWPARSPDLNPIENVWDALGRQVAGRNYPPTNKNTLIRALTEEWDKLPQQLLDNAVQSMVRRVECCITLHGGHIPY